MGDPRDFVPALGRHGLTNSYDRVIAVMTREKRWRSQLLLLVAPQMGDVIVDVGCGTGTFAIMMKVACPGARVIGIDPDEAVLEIARAKAADADVDIEWQRAMGDELADAVKASAATKAVSTLVLHQCPIEMKRNIMRNMRTALVSGGRLFIADYGEQRTFLMRMLFRQVQHLDGHENTQPNADGVLPALIAEAGFADVSETKIVPTPTGSISIYTARRA